MALQFGVAQRNAALDAIETSIGVLPKLNIRTGSPPANCAATATGAILVDAQLPSDFFANATGGQKALSGLWQSNASGSGTPGYFRILDESSNCVIQGTVTLAGAGGDMTLDSATVTSGQQFTVTSFTITAGGA